MWAVTDDGYIFYKDNRTKPVKGNGKRDVQCAINTFSKRRSSEMERVFIKLLREQREKFPE